MQLHQHVNTITKSAYFQLSRIGRIRKYLTPNATKSLVHALVISRMDYCNAALYGLPDHLLRKLQRVQNNAARLITLTHRNDHISPVLQTLHWLPVEERITYKVLLLTFKALHGLAPVYLSDLLKPYTPSRSLRSVGQNLLQEPDYRLKTYGARSFQCAAPRLWNLLPYNIRTITDFGIFKNSVKTFLFRRAYGL